jgi:adenylate cyclase
MIKKKETKSKFKQYVAKSGLGNNGNRRAFGVEIKHLTLLLSALRSFTAISEMESPQELMSAFGLYLTEMVDVIHRYGGTVDKIIGDEIMAEFGIATHLPNHAELACLTALEMIRVIRPFNRLRVREGKVAFKIQIGINTGDMPVGNMGSKQIHDYTVIGPEVTLGVRLMGANRMYGLPVIISEATKNELSDKIVTRELDKVIFRGLTKPVVIFELVGGKDTVIYSEEFLAHYYEGLTSYKKREWNRAIEEFKKALVFNNEDYVSKIYIDRCKQLMRNPPPPDWDGVFKSLIR